MEEIFLRLLNMSISTGWIVLPIVILRKVLKKMPKAIRCVLWALVAIRLLIPITLESGFSLIPSIETIPQNIMYEKQPTIHSGISFVNCYVNPVISDTFAHNVGDSVNPLQVVIFIATWVWIIGIVVMLLYAIYSYQRIYKRVLASIVLKENIYVCDDIATPFILGMIKPRIYLPSDLEQDISIYVIAHEQAHIKRRDHWWKPLGFMLLTIYWFQPMLWIAYVLFSRDIELACDEKVIKELGEVEKKPYSKALLQCSISRKMIIACPLAFGEVGVKERVRNVLNYKKPRFWVFLGAIGICMVMGICFLTNPKEILLHAPEPFCHSYYVEEIIYDAPQYNFAYTEETAPLYSFSADYVMESKGDILNSVEDWVTIGWMNSEIIKLNKRNFDAYFKDIDGISGWKDSYTAAKIRRNNEATWELIREDESSVMSYYLLKQKDGEIYLACWYEHEDDDSLNHVRWLFRLKDRVNRQELEQGTYIFKSCIYMNPLSSYIPIGDVEETYEVGEHSFTIYDHKNNSGKYIETYLEWQEFPYTDEEWSALYAFELEEKRIREISKFCDDIGYISLVDGYCLMRVNDVVWLAKINHDKLAGIDYIWSIYHIERQTQPGE